MRYKIFPYTTLFRSHGKRLISYGKLFKTTHKELNLEDEENLNLIQTDDKDEISEEEILANSIVAKWNYKKQNYLDRKSTRLNSSHVSISYAVFCLKK